MSKFGAHLSLGRHDGFGTALQQCANAGSPIPLIFVLDQNVWPDIERYSPQTTLIFRTQINTYDNPPQIYTGDPVAIATDWFLACLPKWRLNQAHYYAPSNERNPLPEQDAWIDAFDLQMMKLADDEGLKLAIHGDSQGTPEISRWNNYRASLQHAAAHGHIVHAHEPVTGAGLAFRYRDIHAVTEQFAPGLLMAISECYGDLNGDWNHYVDSFMPYDAEAMRDKWLIGFGAYQLGGDENWYTAIPRWADYVATHPTPIVTPPADEREFDYWLDEDTGAIVSRDNPFDLHVTRAGNYKAITRPKVTPPQTVPISVSTDGYGSVTGGGQYVIGSDARLEWKP